MEHLIFYGADSNAQTSTNETALHICVENNKVTAVHDMYTYEMYVFVSLFIVLEYNTVNTGVTGILVNLWNV